MTWYRSLYWRIAFGVVGLIAATLIVQAMLFVWAVSQTGRTLPGQSPGRLGLTVALDLANELSRDPKVDLARYVHDQYAPYTHPFFVMMADGTLITSGSQSFPEPLLRMARARLQGPPRFGRFEGPRPEGARPDGERPEGARTDGPRLDRPRGPRPDRPEWWQQPDRFVERLERDTTGRPFVRPSPIVVDGKLAGVVVVPPQAPFGFLLGRFAPMLGLVATAVLIVGAVVTSALIFGPPRRRLRELESAARRLGAGDLSARAPARGGDEISAVASAFNTMADDLSARAAALTESDRVRRQLLADVSHELTTPITAMRGYLETLSMPEVTLDEATRSRYLGIIGDEAGRLERLVGDLLDLARLEDGGGTLKIEDVPVAQLFDRVTARHERACGDAGVRMQVTIGAGGEIVTGDRGRLEQALQNLAANAIRYAPSGSAIRLASRGDAGGGVLLTVEDEGAAGIAPEHVPHIFDRFYKADPSRAGRADGRGLDERERRPDGSGLGLSIVKAIIERHGGRIAVTSRPGRTVFEMVLPGKGAR
ncbi:MAG: HAMP domain-containing histidine kinase [Acidobacteriia bacterium]|nr:HAMP domain-containing histidine kinase [Terriglobia bacterium]